MEGILSRRCRWFKAVTNFRAVFYDFDAHDGVALTLRKVDAVLVTNKRVESESQHSGQIRTLDSAGPAHPYSNYYGSSQTSSVTFGDVLIMHGGEPVIQLVSIQDQEGVAALIRHVVAESQSSMRRAADSTLPQSSVAGAFLRPSSSLLPQSSSLPPAEVRQAGKGLGSGSDENDSGDRGGDDECNNLVVCPKCGSHNPAGSSFCNGCGSKLDYACSKCGYVNATDARFCSQCGSQL